MANVNLDILLLHKSNQEDLLEYFKKLRNDYKEIDICRSFLKAIDDEFITSRCACQVFLRSSSVEVVSLCMKSSPTNSLRRLAFKVFRNKLSKLTKWESMWTAVGGTQGLIDLFAQLSVKDVKSLSAAIGSCSKSNRSLSREAMDLYEARQRSIEQLVKALVPSHYPGASRYTSLDQRPIQHLYKFMIVPCSLQFILSVLESQDETNPLLHNLSVKPLLKVHGDALREIVSANVFSPKDKKLNHFNQFLEAFIYREPSLPSADPNSRLSASMEFATNLLQRRVQNLDNLQFSFNGTFEAKLLFNLFKRAVQKKLPDNILHDMMMLGIQTLDVKKFATFDNNVELLAIIVSRWIKNQQLYQDVLSCAIKSFVKYDSFMRILNKLLKKFPEKKKELKFSLLKLFCLNVYGIEVDLDASSDMKPLLKLDWDTKIFSYFQRNQTVWLFECLYKAGLTDNRFRCLDSSSIMSPSYGINQNNFRVCLFRELLSRGSEEAKQRCELVIHNLRKKSESSTNQSGRCNFALAATSYAIASGSIDLYGEIIRWQQRYIRDVFTFKTLFSNKILMTVEGIDLLSGISKHENTDMTVASAATVIELSNKIFTTLYESRNIAKREPWFHNDGHQLHNLLKTVIDERLKGYSKINCSIVVSPLDLYHSVWSNTLICLKTIDSSLLLYTMLELSKILPPRVLKYMINEAFSSMANTDRNNLNDNLMKGIFKNTTSLAKSDRPELAEDLVLNIVLEQPTESSWHRELLSLWFLNRLAAKNSNDIVLNLAMAIGEKLEEQSYVQVSDPQKPETSASTSIVKVTTGKYLAQILQDSDFISTTNALNILIELFKRDIHIDIRVATFDGLVENMNKLCNKSKEGWRSNSSIQKVLTAFESLVPLLGNVNQNRPVTELEWHEARETKKLPRISLDTQLLAQRLIILPREYSNFKSMRAEFLERFILPIVRLSKTEFKKWVSLFLSKYNAENILNIVPPMLATRDLWNLIVEGYLDILPEDILEDYNQHIVGFISLPRALKRFNRKLNKMESDQKNLPEIQNWLKLFNTSVNGISRTEHLAVYIGEYYWSSKETVSYSLDRSARFQKLSDMIISQAELLLSDYERHIQIWKGLLRAFGPPKSVSDRSELLSVFSSWEKTGKIILGRLDGLLKDRRANNLVSRRTELLPSPISVQIQLLPYPEFSNESTLEERCIILSNAIENMLLDCITRTPSIQWSSIKEDLFQIIDYLDEEQSLLLASYLGILEKTNDIMDGNIVILNVFCIELIILILDKEIRRSSLSSEELTFSTGVFKRLVTRLNEWSSVSNETIYDVVTRWKIKNPKWKMLRSKYLETAQQRDPTLNHDQHEQERTSSEDDDFDI